MQKARSPFAVPPLSVADLEKIAKKSKVRAVVPKSIPLAEEKAPNSRIQVLPSEKRQRAEALQAIRDLELARIRQERRQEKVLEERKKTVDTIIEERCAKNPTLRPYLVLMLSSNPRAMTRTRIPDTDGDLFCTKCEQLKYYTKFSFVKGSKRFSTLCKICNSQRVSENSMYLRRNDPNYHPRDLFTRIEALWAYVRHKERILTFKKIEAKLKYRVKGPTSITDLLTGRSYVWVKIYWKEYPSIKGHVYAIFPPDQAAYIFENREELGYTRGVLMRLMDAMVDHSLGLHPAQKDPRLGATDEN